MERRRSARWTLCPDRRHRHDRRQGLQADRIQKAEGFTGTFDGQFHSIKGLRVEYEKKYAGLFGYVGNQNDQAYIKNVALLDCYVTGQQNVGALAGVNYGTITDCVVTGEVKCLDLSNSHTAGGICGKLKEGEGPIVGHVEDCYVNADVSAPYDAGGIAGIQDGGGYLAAASQPARSMLPRRAAR